MKIKVAIISVLSYRLPKYPKYLSIKIESIEKRSLLNNPPGNLYKYYGNKIPSDSENSEIEEKNEYIEINVRDLLAALQRMLMIKNDHKKPKLVIRGNHNVIDNFVAFLSKNGKFGYFIELHSINNSLDISEQEKLGKISISEDIIHAIEQCLKDSNPFVRETAVSSLGKIGLPEALPCLDSIIHLISDSVINVKTKAIWCLGKVADCCDTSVINNIIENLKSNVWKVKMACFITISAFGHRCTELVLPSLKKMLKESSVNKQIIAETIMKLGNEGEHYLIEVMKIEMDSNYKLKASIAKSFALTLITSPNLDFIVECLYKHVE